MREHLKRASLTRAKEILESTGIFDAEVDAGRTTKNRQDQLLTGVAYLVEHCLEFRESINETNSFPETTLAEERCIVDTLTQAGQ